MVVVPCGDWNTDTELDPQEIGPAVGFTWGDVDLQTGRAEELEAIGMADEARPFRNLADRIASLLPPREEPK